MSSTPRLVHCLILVCGLATFSEHCLAKTIQVKVEPDTDVITKAIQSASAGDSIVLEAGVYREQIRIDKQLKLLGKDGVVLDGSIALEVEWSPAEGMEHVFVAATKSRPEGLLLGGKFLPEIRYDRAKKEGDWHWRTLLSKGTPLSGFEFIRAAWMYHPEEKAIYLRMPDDASPVGAALSWVKNDKPLIDIQAKGVEVEGLDLVGAVTAVAFTEGAEHSILRRCRVLSYEGSGVLLTEGASNCTVEKCVITRGALEEWQPTNERRRENYEIWRLHKEVGKYDRVGIELIQAGRGNRILNNHLDRVFDGINIGDYRAESLDKPLPDPDHGRDTEIAYNTIENTRDSGMELGVGCINVNVHHNRLSRTHGGFRFKAPRIGPVFIHHNHLSEGTPFNFWFSMDSSPAEGYIYHNTIEGGDEAFIVYSSFNAQRDFATPNWHFLNNLALKVEDGFFGQRKNTPARDFKESNNITADDVEAAKGAGLDLSTYFKGGPLPGCEKGYFEGKAPDAGYEKMVTSE